MIAVLLVAGRTLLAGLCRIALVPATPPSADAIYAMVPYLL